MTCCRRERFCALAAYWLAAVDATKTDRQLFTYYKGRVVAGAIQQDFVVEYVESIRSIEVVHD